MDGISPSIHLMYWAMSPLGRDALIFVELGVQILHQFILAHRGIPIC
jgi:hypothetical protein